MRLQINILNHEMIQTYIKNIPITLIYLNHHYTLKYDENFT